MDLIIKTEIQTIAIVIKDNLRGFRLNQAGIVFHLSDEDLQNISEVLEIHKQEVEFLISLRERHLTILHRPGQEIQFNL